MNIERRTIGRETVKLESRADDQPPVITGYAAVYYDGTPETEYKLWDGAVERIAPGAFDRASKEDDVRALFNHDPNHVLGRSTAGTLKLVTDDRGLRYEIMPPDTASGRDLVALLKRGDITGSSFAFVVDEQRWIEKNDSDKPMDIREIVAVQLFDVGPVTYPAYEGTESGVRSEQRAALQKAAESARASRYDLAAHNARLIRIADAE